MKKLSIFFVFVLMTVTSVMGQSNVLDGIYTKEHVTARKPIPYYHLRQADVQWSKVVWRMLDLKEKANHPLYYPTAPTDDRVSLVQLMLDGIENEGINVYEYDLDHEFKTVLTKEEIYESLGAAKDSAEQYDPVSEEYTMNYTNSEPRPDEVLRMLMKEQWVFDKQRSKMEVRIIGLCPIRRYIKETNAEGIDPDEKVLDAKTLFWAYFPSFRPLFAIQEVFNPNNDAERRTFDDIFFKRKFASHIYRITNVYDNREIKEYKKGEDLLLEAERIKDWMFKFEQDLWEM